MRAAATAFGFFDFMIADPKSGRLIYTVEKEVDFATSLRDRPLPPLQCRRRCRPLRRRHRQIGRLPRGFRPLCALGRRTHRLHGGADHRPGIVIGVLIAQLSNEEIDNVVTGDRRWRQEGFGATGEAYLVGPDYLVRSGPRAFYENRDQLLRRAEAVAARTRRSTPSAATARQCCISAFDRATRAALAGVEGTGEIIGYRGMPTLASWGPLAIPGIKWALSPRSTPPRLSPRSTSCGKT